MIFNKILEKNQKWVQEKLQTDSEFFKKLSQGQRPEYLYIGCSDSRITAEDMMGMNPGEVFVHRNIANQIIPTDANVGSVIQYAVEHLKIKYIIVCGHYECGGVKAALNPSDLGQLNNWLQTLRDVYRLHKVELDALKDEQTRFDRLVELNVLEQCNNVIKSTHVQRSWYKTGFPKVFGWVLDVRTGSLKDLGLNMETEFTKIRKIYDLRPLSE